MSAPHIPVLLDEVVSALAPAPGAVALLGVAGLLNGRRRR